MAEFKWSGYKAAASTYLSTELNSLLNGANKLGAEVDNSTNLYMFEDLEIYIATLDLSAATNPHIKIYLLISQDGTNYPDGSDSIDPVETNAVYSAALRKANSAHRAIIRGVVLPPGKFKYLIQNQAGADLPASGNTLKRRSYNTQSV